MRRLVFLPQATTDLIAIAEYLAEASGSIVVGRNFAAQLRATCKRLASLPGTMGRQRDDIQAELRSAAMGNYIILFRYGPSAFQVVRILEGHRNIRALFDPEAPS